MIAQRIYEYKKALKEAEMFLKSKNFHDDRFELLGKMEKTGGHFAKKLAECLWIADRSNYHIGIKFFWHTVKPYIKKELYDFEDVYCECGDAGEYTALYIATSIFKKGDDWLSDREVIGGEFRCDKCDGLMPEEIEEKAGV